MIALAGMALAVAALYQIWPYLTLPADILSFAESPFVTDIIKYREGVPIYLPAGDNNSYPYSPATPILTYLIASMAGMGTSIAALRIVQFGYVLLASFVALAATASLAELVMGRSIGRLWLAAWWPFLLLVCLDPTFNAYVHSLHNDGLALLVSTACFWVVTRHSLSPRLWHFVAMALLPALGFMVKQNQAMWLGLFAFYMIIEGSTGWRRTLVVSAVGASSIGLTVLAEYALWGDSFWFWTITALGDKQVSILRSIRHLTFAGGYAAMGLVAGVVLVRRQAPRGIAALWVVWAMMFAIQAYTSGLGFAANHLGPGVVVATIWFLVLMLRLWPAPDGSGVQDVVRSVVAAAALVLVFGGLGVVREPRSGVPEGVYRFIAAIEDEFDGMDPSAVLLDNGSWIYLREGVVMRDRSAPVSLHVGINQPEINRAALVETIGRIEERQYARILVRMLDTPRSDYDFQDRGSGVKSAMLANYDVVRRISGVDVGTWWPRGMLGEVLVMEPKPRG